MNCPTTRSPTQKGFFRKNVPIGEKHHIGTQEKTVEEVKSNSLHSKHLKHFVRTSFVIHPFGNTKVEK